MGMTRDCVDVTFSPLCRAAHRKAPRGKVKTLNRVTTEKNVLQKIEDEMLPQLWTNVVRRWSIAEAASLAGREWWSGVVLKWTVTVSEGAPHFDLFSLSA